MWTLIGGGTGAVVAVLGLLVWKVLVLGGRTFTSGAVLLVLLVGAGIGFVIGGRLDARRQSR